MSRSRSPRRGPLPLALCLSAVFAAVILTPAVAASEPLAGDLVDALTRTPVPDARVRVLGTNRTARTDARGRFRFDLPPGTYELEFRATLGDRTHTVRLVNQYVPQIKRARARLHTPHFVDAGVPAAPGAWGLPGAGSGQLPDVVREAGPFHVDDLFEVVADPRGLTLPTTVPRTIRVGRRETPEDGCRNNPIVAIEEMDIDEYVEGVLPPEIGVFRSLQGVSEVYKAFGMAAKSYGLWFMLTYSEGRDAGGAKPPHGYTWFHIDDTACNQRYSDTRYTITTSAARSVADQILVAADRPDTLDKLEYAASCGEHGTLPEYGDIDRLIDDASPVRSCVGNWCGHDGCAGHQDNPHLAGDDRCLVRGICQWGAAEWGESGKSYTWMIEHYQPNLQIRDLSEGAVEETVELVGYVYTDPQDVPGSGVADIEVTLSDGQTARTDGRGLFRFERVALSEGEVTLGVDAPGYAPAMRDKALVAGVTNWASVQVVADGSGPADMGTPPADMGSSSGGDTGGVDTVDTGASSGGDLGARRRRATLGPVVTRSEGIDGGCVCTSPGAPAPAHDGAYVVAALGLACAGIWRRRRER